MLIHFSYSQRKPRLLNCLISITDAIIFLVDNKQYGKIIPPPNGISQFFTNEKPEVTEKWALSGKMAPFNKEVRHAT